MLSRRSLIFLLALAACTTPPTTERTSQPTSAPEPVNPPVSLSSKEAPVLKREFRAAWVSTVANIDWPSRRELSVEKQKAEAIAILDMAVSMKLNALILQVRPAADAIYPSSLEPWSEFLTGEQGRAPSPYYDPLAFWVAEAHNRGLELHAWFNPYRARTPSNKNGLAKNHISKTAPEAVKVYGDLLWMDPAEPAAAEQTLAVINDVVQRYDIDGVHIDDYFYPYPIKNAQGVEVDFPDDAAWLRYLQSGGQLMRADWRRTQVNRLVQAIDESVHRIKPWVKFGISPFGLGRPERWPAGITGFSQYDKLYADVELWLSQGWLDYLAPQLYWPIEQTAQAFKVLHSYWQGQNTLNRHLWAGMYTSRIDASEKSWPPEEIANQVEALREQASTGHVHFSVASLMQNRKGVRELLTREKYTQTALVPATPWRAPVENFPTAQLQVANGKLQVQLSQREHMRWLVLWQRNAQAWQVSLHSAQATSLPLKGADVHQIQISMIDRFGRESAATNLNLQP